MENRKHLIVKKYLKEHSLVESNIISFNNFLEKRMQEIVNEISETLEITVKKDDQVDSEIVEIGKIPIMVKSKACNSNGMSRDELIKSYHDPLDPGGYFIIRGNERVMVMAEDLAENQPFIESDSRRGLSLKLFSLKGTYRIPVLISESKEGILYVPFNENSFKESPRL